MYGIGCKDVVDLGGHCLAGAATVQGFASAARGDQQGTGWLLGGLASVAHRYFGFDTQKIDASRSHAFQAGAACGIGAKVAAEYDPAAGIVLCVYGAASAGHAVYERSCENRAPQPVRMEGRESKKDQ